MNNINQTRNSTVKIENDLKFVDDLNEKKVTNIMTKSSPDSKLEETLNKNLTKKSTLENATPNATLPSTSTGSNSVEQGQSSLSCNSNNDGETNSSPDVRQRRLQHFQTNATSQ